jgi:hypothetical protein
LGDLDGLCPNPTRWGSTHFNGSTTPCMSPAQGGAASHAPTVHHLSWNRCFPKLHWISIDVIERNRGSERDRREDVVVWTGRLTISSESHLIVGDDDDILDTCWLWRLHNYTTYLPHLFGSLQCLKRKKNRGEKLSHDSLIALSKKETFQY